MALPITLHIYDVTTETTVRAVNGVFRAVGTGAFHAAVEVLGVEYSFGYIEEGTGVFACEPKLCDMHNYRESLPMGESPLSPSEVADLIAKLSAEWPGEEYDLLKRNCCHFSDTFCQELGVGPIPGWVTNLAGAGATLKDTASATKEFVSAAAVIAAAKAGEVDDKYKISGTVHARAKDLLDRGILIDDKYQISARIASKVSSLDQKYQVTDKVSVATATATKKGEELIATATPAVTAAAATGAAVAGAAASKGAALLGSMFGSKSTGTK